MDTDQIQEKEVLLRQFCTFYTTENLYGIDINDVEEIKNEFKFTRVYHAPKEVLGFVNIRSQVYLILDLRVLLRFDPKPPDNQSRLILFKKDAGNSFGILVDRIGDVIEIEKKYIEYQPLDMDGLTSSEQTKTNLSTGIFKKNGRIVIILNAGNFLPLLAKRRKEGERVRLMQ